VLQVTLVVTFQNESRTNRARIADSGAVRLRSRRYLATISDI